MIKGKLKDTKKNQFERHNTRIIAAVFAAAMILTACSGGGSDKAFQEEPSMGYAKTDQIYETGSQNAEASSMTEDREGMSAPMESNISEVASQSERKLIKNVDMDVETEEYDKLLLNIRAKIEALSGYVENMSTGEDTSIRGQENGNRYASITARVPSDKVDQFVTNLSEISNVIRKNETINDITLQYVDLESHKKALLTEENRLMELLESAGNVEDIISIETRLSEVRYQIDSMESQLRIFDNQINYSTVYIYITEVNRLTPAEGKGTWEKITTGFKENVYLVGKGCKDFVIAILINLPIIVVFATVCILLFFFIRMIRVKSKLWIRRGKKENGHISKEARTIQEEVTKDATEDKK